MTTYNDYSIELRSYLSTLQKHGFKILSCSNDGGESDAARFADVTFDEFVEECMGADECHLFCRSPLGSNVSIYFVYGNSCGEIAADYAGRELEPVNAEVCRELEPVNAEHGKNWDGKDVPTMEG